MNSELGHPYAKLINQ